MCDKFTFLLWIGRPIHQNHSKSFWKPSLQTFWPQIQNLAPIACAKPSKKIKSQLGNADPCFLFRNLCDFEFKTCKKNQHFLMGWQKAYSPIPFWWMGLP